MLWLQCFGHFQTRDNQVTVSVSFVPRLSVQWLHVCFCFNFALLYKNRIFTRFSLFKVVPN